MSKSPFFNISLATLKPNYLKSFFIWNRSLSKIGYGAHSNPRPEGGKEPPNPASAGETWKLENLAGGERQAAPAAAAPPAQAAEAAERHRRSIEVPVQQIQFPNEPVQQVQIDSSTTKKTPKLAIVRNTEGKLPKKLLRKSTL